MSIPGEVIQSIDRAYVLVLTGCLEHTIKPFEQYFDVYNSPEKLTFKKYGEEGIFSFDASGIYHLQSSCEVFIKAKEYAENSSLMNDYRAFVAKSYIPTVLNYRHSKDYFCFVINVPFATSIVKKITSKNFLLQKIFSKRESYNELSSILGNIDIDPDYVESLSKRLAVCFFTDSFIKFSGISYKVKKGESLWTIMEKLHNNVLNVNFDRIGETVKRLNPKLKDIDLIVEGERLHLPWYGIERY